jgi:hypothetical protein
MSDNNFDPGQGQTPPYSPPPQPQYNPNPAPTPPPQYGPNPYMEVPPEIRKWNWGAFSFNLFWGIGNKAWLALLCLIPCFNIIWMFVCGALGNQWAWKSGEFKDVEQFMAAQRTWNRAGLVYFIINIAGVVLLLLFWGAIFTFFGRYSGSLYGYDW